VKQPITSSTVKLHLQTRKFITILLLGFLISPAILKAQQASHFFPERDLVTPGIYYYPEHWSENQWERDIKKMSEMGFEFVHLAEFAWFKMEPEEGKFDFSWLDKVLSLCAKGII
jgi:beta-galactosidase